MASLCEPSLPGEPTSSCGVPPAPQLGILAVTFGSHRLSFSFLLLLIFHRVALAHNMSDTLTVFYN